MLALHVLVPIGIYINKNKKNKNYVADLLLLALVPSLLVLPVILFT